MTKAAAAEADGAPAPAGGDAASAALAPAPRSAYRAFLAIPTRWMDNDTYGHVNNVTYYAYFDTVVNEHLIREGGLDIRGGPSIGIVVETACRFHKPLSFPEMIDAGLRVARIGRSSVTYEIALFRAGDDDAAATGRFVHVWVDRIHRRPVAVPDTIRAALDPLRVDTARSGSPNANGSR
jgi:acyl-CoA thioester hydrolase